MKAFLDEHLTKILGAILTTLGTLSTLITTGAFTGLMPDNDIRWLGIWVSLATTLFGGATAARGFNNSAKVRVAEAMQTAINAQPPSQQGFARLTMLALLLALVAALAMSGCTVTPVKVIEQPCTVTSQYRAERCAKAIAETWETYQKRIEDITSNPLAPPELKTHVRHIEGQSRIMIVLMLKAAQAVATVKADLHKGMTSEEQLAIANAELEKWVRIALPLVDDLREVLDKPRKFSAKPASATGQGAVAGSVAVQ